MIEIGSLLGRYHILAQLGQGGLYECCYWDLYKTYIRNGKNNSRKGECDADHSHSNRRR